jgi:hypothetical protein
MRGFLHPDQNVRNATQNSYAGPSTKCSSCPLLHPLLRRECSPRTVSDVENINNAVAPEPKWTHLTPHHAVSTATGGSE